MGGDSDSGTSRLLAVACARLEELRGVLERSQRTAEPAEDRRAQLVAWRRAVEDAATAEALVRSLSRTHEQLRLRVELAPLSDAEFTEVVGLEDWSISMVRGAAKALKRATGAKLAEVDKRLRAVNEAWPGPVLPEALGAWTPKVVHVDASALRAQTLSPMLLLVLPDPTAERLRELLPTDDPRKVVGALVWFSEHGEFAVQLLPSQLLADADVGAYVQACIETEPGEAPRGTAVSDPPWVEVRSRPGETFGVWRVWETGAIWVGLHPCGTLQAIADETVPFQIGGHRWRLSEAIDDERNR